VAIRVCGGSVSGSVSRAAGSAAALSVASFPRHPHVCGDLAEFHLLSVVAQLVERSHRFDKETLS
jgi:hypothetical protein